MYGNNQQVGGRRSTGSMNCPQGQSPFMFGGSYAGAAQNNGYSASATSFGNHPSVRECMFWPTSLPAGGSTGSNYTAQGNYSNYNNGGGYSQRVAAPMVTRQPAASMNDQCVYPQPKAFIQYHGMGGGESKMQPIPIPCRLGPSGSAMAPLAAAEPLTIKVTAPVGAGQDGKPIAIQIDPSQFMGMASVKAYPTRRN